MCGRRMEHRPCRGAGGGGGGGDDCEQQRWRAVVVVVVVVMDTARPPRVSFEAGGPRVAAIAQRRGGQCGRCGAAASVGCTRRTLSGGDGAGVVALYAHRHATAAADVAIVGGGGGARTAGGSALLSGVLRSPRSGRRRDHRDARQAGGVVGVGTAGVFAGATYHRRAVVLRGAGSDAAGYGSGADAGRVGRRRRRPRIFHSPRPGRSIAASGPAGDATTESAVGAHAGAAPVVVVVSVVTRAYAAVGDGTWPRAVVVGRARCAGWQFCGGGAARAPAAVRERAERICAAADDSIGGQGGRPTTGERAIGAGATFGDAVRSGGCGCGCARRVATIRVAGAEWIGGDGGGGGRRGEWVEYVFLVGGDVAGRLGWVAVRLRAGLDATCVGRAGGVGRAPEVLECRVAAPARPAAPSVAAPAPNLEEFYGTESSEETDVEEEEEEALLHWDAETEAPALVPALGARPRDTPPDAPPADAPVSIPTSSTSPPRSTVRPRVVWDGAQPDQRTLPLRVLVWVRHDAPTDPEWLPLALRLEMAGGASRIAPTDRLVVRAVSGDSAADMHLPEPVSGRSVRAGGATTVWYLRKQAGRLPRARLHISVESAADVRHHAEVQVHLSALDCVGVRSDAQWPQTPTAFRQQQRLLGGVMCPSFAIERMGEDWTRACAERLQQAAAWVTVPTEEVNQHKLLLLAGSFVDTPQPSLVLLAIAEQDDNIPTSSSAQLQVTLACDDAIRCAPLAAQLRQVLS
eukprot:ctg_1983.g419